jgi:putative DNA primase/helicase
MMDVPGDPDAILRDAGAREESFTHRGSESPEYSDDALALAFTERHADTLLYVPAWGHWLRWDGGRWRRDETLAVFDLARAICREQAAPAGSHTRRPSEATAARIASAGTVAAVERLARADRRHAREAGDFDADPWALNTPAGVVDLRSGRLRPHRRADLHTRITGAAPGGECPRWRRFLVEITEGDTALADYLQRWAGYTLTGETREHAFLVLCGPGGNGKSVLVNTIAAALGDYAATAPMETFMASQHDRHPTDLAGLRGARLVTAHETEAGRVLAEARLKALTAGDTIAARFMRADFFSFRPTFKLVMVGNYRPVIRNPDAAMRRRLHLLPITFTPTAPDHGLEAALRAELPGILAWAVAGCLAWQSEGLGMPNAVREATAAYFADQDLLAQWLGERCEVRRGEEVASSALFRDWSQWTKARGEVAGTSKAFSAALERHHAKKRTSRGMAFIGLRLLIMSHRVV